jgi:Fic/DOC family
MSPVASLQLSVAARERRLAALLEERGLTPADAGLAEVVADAQLLGSLELSGHRFSWDDVRSSRTSGSGPEEIVRLRRARAAVAPDAPFTVDVVQRWHAALFGGMGFRRGPREREGPGAAPVEFIPSRLATLGEWLAAREKELEPAPAGALALARIVEILPFDDGNGRVSRLAASHVMVRARARPPILVAADGPRLRAAIEAAVRYETEPLVALLAEASSRALDVMIQWLGRPGASGG